MGVCQSVRNLSRGAGSYFFYIVSGKNKIYLAVLPFSIMYASKKVEMYLAAQQHFYGSLTHYTKAASGEELFEIASEEKVVVSRHSNALITYMIR